MGTRSRLLALGPVAVLFTCCVCIVIRSGLPHARIELDEAGALHLVESHYVKVHHEPTINGHDQTIAPHGWASIHEQKALELAEGKTHGDMGGRWITRHHPHSINGEDKQEKAALALAEGKMRGDIAGSWAVHHKPHVTAGEDAAEMRALAIAESDKRGDVGGRWKMHYSPHVIAGNDEHEKRALELAEGKLRYHPQAHAVAANSAQEMRALALAEGKESNKLRTSIAAGHAKAIAKKDQEEVTVQSKWGPLSAARAGRQQQLRAIEAHVPNMHFDKGVSARKVEALLQRAQHQTGMSFPLKRMHVKHQSPLVQLNQVQELNAIEKRMGREQRAMELALKPSAPLSPTGSAHARDWRHAARGRRDNSQREALALQLAEEPSAPVGMEEAKHEHERAAVRERKAPHRASKGANKGKDYYNQATFEENAIENAKRAQLAEKQTELKRMMVQKHEAAKAHQALRGMDVLAHGAQRALDDDMVSANAVRRGFFGL